MSPQSVYIETSIVSYLTARPTGDLLAAAWQKTTHDWWDMQRGRFDLYTSDVSIEEAEKGDPGAAARRIETLSKLPLLAITDAVVTLSKTLIKRKALPAVAFNDALHIAVSAVHEMDYLLTWNFRHLDNAETKPIIRAVCIAGGYSTPEICTPQELMGANDHGR